MIRRLLFLLVLLITAFDAAPRRWLPPALQPLQDAAPRVVGVPRASGQRGDRRRERRAGVRQRASGVARGAGDRGRDDRALPRLRARQPLLHRRSRQRHQQCLDGDADARGSCPRRRRQGERPRRRRRSRRRAHQARGRRAQRQLAGHARSHSAVPDRPRHRTGVLGLRAERLWDGHEEPRGSARQPALSRAVTGDPRRAGRQRVDHPGEHSLPAAYHSLSRRRPSLSLSSRSLGSEDSCRRRRRARDRRDGRDAGGEPHLRVHPAPAGHEVLPLPRAAPGSPADGSARHVRGGGEPSGQLGRDAEPGRRPRSTSFGRGAGAIRPGVRPPLHGSRQEPPRARAEGERPAADREGDQPDV